MAWNIASIPFWFVGLFFLVNIFTSIAIRSPGETWDDQLRQAGWSFVFSSACLLIAAKIVS
jgi:hypothetical protein